MGDKQGYIFGVTDALTQSIPDENALSAHQGYRLAHGEARDSDKVAVAGDQINGSLILNNSLILSSSIYGNTLPTTGSSGQIFFLKQPNTSSIVANDLLNLVRPIGSIYMSVESTSPRTLFGGTWTQLQNRFLLGAGDTYTNGATGGVTTHTHNTKAYTLTTANLPAHTHGSKTLTGTMQSILMDDKVTGGIVVSGICSATAPRQRSFENSDGTAIYKVTINMTHEHTSVGSGSSHNHGATSSGSNMPPYLVVYMWKRTG